MIAGCSPSTRVQPQSHVQPSWVPGLREQIAEVPVTPEQDETRFGEDVAPDAVTALDSQRGVPKDLTQPIDTTGRDRRPSSRPAPTPTPSPAGAGRSTNKESSRLTPDVGTPPVEASSFETLYRGEYGQDPDRELEQFGYRYFEDSDLIDEAGPVPARYVIGPDDEIIVSVWGSWQAIHRLTVDRDGQISLPEAGTIVVAGQTFADLPSVIRRTYEQVRKNFELSIAMGRLRRIQVHVVGNVARPGLTEVSARSSVLSALVAAGGPMKDGSLRDIQLRRDDETIRIDLYEFLVSGETASEDLLRGGDLVFVPPIGATVGLAGSVRRPGIYETTGEITVGEAIELAGGLTPFTFTPHAQLERTVDGRLRERIDLALDDNGMAATMQDGEMLLIGAIDQRRQPVIQISGEVSRPGVYPFRSGLRLSDLLTNADGLTVDAWLPQALISRQIGQSGELETIPERVSLTTSRRVMVVDLRKVAKGDPEHDIELLPLDHVEISSRDRASVRPIVSVLGPVQRPGTYELTHGLRISDLVAMAGNLRPNTFYEEAELIRRIYDAEARLLDVRRFRFNLGRALALDPINDPLLRNGDQVVIRAMRESEVTVEVTGEVRFPGTYVFPAGTRITELLAAAGGVLESGDLRAAKFTRTSVHQMQQERLENLIEQTRQRFESAMERMVQTGQQREGIASRLSLDQTRALLQRMTRYQVTGRVVVPFTREDFPNSAFNLVLEDGDSLRIPRHQETVTILGHVFNPSTFVAEPELTVRNVIDRAGGVTEYADNKRTYVIRADGTVEDLSQLGKRGRQGTVLLAGDTVLVPKEPLEKTFGSKLADGLRLVRQASEAALLLSNLGEGLDVTTVFPSSAPTGNVTGYDDAILGK
jgi:protein involved in polysaccharide export with SLBB domain